MSSHEPKLAYEAPRILDEHALTGALTIMSNKPQSDAEIKHGVQPIRSYATPAIIDQADLEGTLGEFVSQQGSDAEIKHNLRPLS